MAVAGLARGEERLRTTMDEVAAATGARTLAVAADVTDRESVEAAVARVTDELGRVDLLVNNAGLVDAAEVPLWEADPDQWWDVVSSHIRGGFLLCRAVVPWMLLRNRGRVVNIASGMSVRARPEYSAYTVAKTGLMRMTEALAGALEGSDVRVFDLAPGRDPDRHDPRHAAARGAGPTGRRPSGSSSWSRRSPPASWTRGPAGSCTPARTTSTPCARITPDGTARQLRLRPYGDDDPTGLTRAPAGRARSRTTCRSSRSRGGARPARDGRARSGAAHRGSAR